MNFFAVGFKKDEKMQIYSRVCGPDPGYVSTSIFATECALLVLSGGLNVNSGVVTTATAFHGTELIKNLQNRGIKFELVNKSMK